MVFTLALAACGGGQASSAGSSAASSSASTSSASASAEAQASDSAASASASAEAADTSVSESAASASQASASTEAQASQLVGKPWVTSILLGNLPSEQPELKDDMYTHYNYEYIAAHQSQGSAVIAEHTGEVAAALLQIINDDSKIGHDLDQLRIFFGQAADLDTVKAAGIAELKPYLDRIDAVTSIDEMNALLAADDFPFSPFIFAALTTNDTRATNIVGITANLVLFDPMAVGGMYYQETDDPQQQAAMDAAIQNAAGMSVIDFMSAGVETSTVEERQAIITKLADFEKAHGKYLESQSKYLKSDYGAMAEAAHESYFTLDEVVAISPNFPIKETLEKLGKAGSETYVVTRAWLEALNGLWTADNLEAIKLVAKAKVLSETRPYRDPSTMDAVLEQVGQPAKEANAFAYEACANLDTFAQVMAKAYVDNALGASAKERLAKLSQDLVDEYKGLVNGTPWLGEESKARIVEKLDHMALNILEPQGGYFDYSKLELTPTDQGGTLLSNYLKLKQYRWDRESEMVGKPALAAAPWWAISPLMGNAFYNDASNSINVLPGFVTSLVYRDDMDDAELLACAGFTIGHEISHGFDYMGSQLDAYGQPNPVFADADVDAFVLKTSTLAMYYKGIEIGPDLFVDGQNVASEAAADLCGMQANLELAKKSEGFDYEKYFRSAANMWAEVESEIAFQQHTVDNHPLNNLRVNVNAQMFDPIYDVFGVVEGDGMYLAPDQRINIWGPKA